MTERAALSQPPSLLLNLLKEKGMSMWEQFIMGEAIFKEKTS